MKLYIGESKKHGQGVFASRNIKKGETLFIVKGKKVKFLIDNLKKAKQVDFDVFGQGKNVWIDPTGFGACINHSCEPNAGIKGKVTIVALCDIKKNEEITIDYSLSESDIFWGFKCTCGTKICRGSVRSVQFLPHSILKDRESHIPGYFKKVLEQFHVSKFKSHKELERAWLRFIKDDFGV